MNVTKGDLLLIKNENGIRHWKKDSVLMITGKKDEDGDYIVKQLCNGGIHNKDEYDGEIFEYIDEDIIHDSWDEYFEFF